MSRVSKNARPERRQIGPSSLNVEFGFILDVIGDEDNVYYIAIVAKEKNVFPADTQLATLPLTHTTEELNSLFGAPEDIVGRRVRIEYRGSDWRKGACSLTVNSQIAPVGTSMEVPSRGFRYAVAGGGSV